MQIDIKLFNNQILPEKITKGDWIDLRTNEDIHMEAGEYHQIKLGVAMKLPDGYEAILAPRSSTFKKWHILQTNSIGCIDNSYSGDNDEWQFPAYAVESTDIKRGERICQFRIQEKMPAVEFNIVEALGGPDRGGFGSSGTM